MEVINNKNKSVDKTSIINIIEKIVLLKKIITIQ